MKIKKPGTFIFVLFTGLRFMSLSAQYGAEYLGWTGNSILPDNEFYNASRWNANAGPGNDCYVTASDTSLDIHWKLAAGKDQWVQCFFVADEPLSLNAYDIFGFDLHGSACTSGYPCHKDHVIEIKFEDGSRQASHTRMGEDGILCVDRWINKLFSNKYDNFFSIPDGFQWDSVRVISFGIKSHPWVDDPQADSGVVSFRNFVGDSIGSWPGAVELDTLVIDQDTLLKINQKAIDFILSRQQSTGLFTTWIEDGSSWLYGQGLVLKVLTIEGIWDSVTPVNASALAAQKLARFLASHQKSDGYWPRAWNSYSGAVIVEHEEDGSIWMGDLPWMMIGLNSYFKKSGDCEVYAAIQKGESFLRSLIDPDGSLYTMNLLTNQRIPVTSSEAYASTIGAFLELEDDDMADRLLSHIDALAWDTDLNCWLEGQYSDRIVLFTNTWLSLLAHGRGYADKSVKAVSLAGRLMYTCGPGQPCGMDGIGPVAVWYEGTLSYIAAGGPGSNDLFSNIRPFINDDGSVPHYNDNIGGTAGIWAVDWHSLDGTSWLYFVTRKESPFEPVEDINLPDCPVLLSRQLVDSPVIKISPNPAIENIYLDLPSELDQRYQVRIFSLDGTSVFENAISASQPVTSLNIEFLKAGIYFIQIRNSVMIYSSKFIKL
jgi:hypothetical protein